MCPSEALRIPCRRTVFVPFLVSAFRTLNVPTRCDGPCAAEWFEPGGLHLRRPSCIQHQLCGWGGKKVLRSDRERFGEELAAAGKNSRQDVVKKYMLLVDVRTKVGG